MDVVLDVDTGVDDALALLLAVRSPALRLLAVSCVAGNAAVDQVVTNTLTVLDAAGAGDVPVARGMARPLLEPARAARHVHGDDGMGDLGLPPTQRRPSSVHAIELLRRTIVEAEAPVTLVPLAPLTNIAVLLRMHPEVADNLDRIILMGGAANVGNATAAAEFNVWQDPEAAEIVFTAGITTVMYGLDVFYDVTLDRADCELLVAQDDAAPRLAGRLLAHQMDRFGGEAATIGDAGAVAAVIEPAGLTTTRLPVRVELAGRHTRGQTLCDRRTSAVDLDNDPAAAGYDPPGPVDVALGVDGARYRELFLRTLLDNPDG
jgi:inosine-uridine nucleoside N-ribohydrolase